MAIGEIIKGLLGPSSEALGNRLRDSVIPKQNDCISESNRLAYENLDWKAHWPKITKFAADSEQRITKKEIWDSLGKLDGEVVKDFLVKGKHTASIDDKSFNELIRLKVITRERLEKSGEDWFAIFLVFALPLLVFGNNGLILSMIGMIFYSIYIRKEDKVFWMFKPTTSGKSFVEFEILNAIDKYIDHKQL